MQRFFQKIQVPFARFALFLVYFWFGILKIIGQSPASPMVEALQHKTLPFIPFDSFIIFFGACEVALGIAFLFRKLDRATVLLFILHMITTAMPLILLPAMIWTGYFVPTLEGQYIIKNIVLVAAVITIAASTQHARK